MYLTKEQLEGMLVRLNGPESTAFLPAQSVEDVIGVGQAAGMRWALELASVPELLHASDQFETGPQAFLEAFAKGIEAVLAPVREIRHQERERKAREAFVERRAQERAATGDGGTESSAGETSPAEVVPDKPKRKVPKAKKTTDG